jgi:hypothetical protein
MLVPNINGGAERYPLRNKKKGFFINNLLALAFLVSLVKVRLALADKIQYCDWQLGASVW